MMLTVQQTTALRSGHAPVRPRNENGVTKHVPSMQIEPETFLRAVEAVFIGFLLLVLIRISHGAADSIASRTGANQEIEDGDAFRQIMYIAMLFGFSTLYLTRFSLKLPKSVSIFQCFILGWMLLSSLWAVQHGLALRRSILLILVFSCLTIGVEILETRRVIRCIYIALAIVMTISLCAVPFFEFAVHPANELDPSIIGCWRGIIYHKNVAGAVSGLAVIFFLHHAINRGRWFDYLLLLISAVFLVGTRAKTSTGFLLPVIFIGLVYRYAWRTQMGRVWLVLIALSAICVSVLVAINFSSDIEAVWNDPRAFTGRTVIWHTALMAIEDHPLLGVGYSSFWASGRMSLLYGYITQPFIEFIAQSHNGFLETAVNGGLIGLTLAVTAAVIVPLKQLLAWHAEDIPLRSFLLTIILFGISVNLLEAQLYTKDKQVWVVFCGSVLLVHTWSRSRYRRSIAPRMIQESAKSRLRPGRATRP